MIEPFGLMVRLPKATTWPEVGGAIGRSKRSRLHRASIWAFWVLVCVIVAARIAMAAHGSLFAFAS